MRIGDICTTDVVCCRPGTTALEAARLMRSRHAGDVVVVREVEKDPVPVGVVTDHDLAVEVLGNGRDAGIMPLSALIRPPLVIAADYEDVHTGLERMRVHGVRRMPVVDDRGALVGIVTLDDLLAALLSHMHTLLETTGGAQRREHAARGTAARANAAGMCAPRASR